MRPTRRSARHLLAAFVLLAALGLPGCDRIALGADHIGDLLQHPADYQGKTVKVAGTVTNALVVPFVGTRLFTVRDDTGEIVVVTYGDLPAVGQKVVARGMFSSVASLGTQFVGPHITIPRS